MERQRATLLAVEEDKQNRARKKREGERGEGRGHQWPVGRRGQKGGEGWAEGPRRAGGRGEKRQREKRERDEKNDQNEKRVESKLKEGKGKGERKSQGNTMYTLFKFNVSVAKFVSGVLFSLPSLM